LNIPIPTNNLEQNSQEKSFVSRKGAERFSYSLLMASRVGLQHLSISDVKEVLESVDLCLEGIKPTRKIKKRNNSLG
jgi:hypothetical protein